MAVKDFDWLGETTDKIRKDLQAKKGSKVDILIKDWVLKRISVAQQMLADEDRNGTGSLSASIKPKELVTTNEKIILEVVANDYWDDINSGVDGFINKGSAIFNSFGAKYSFNDLNIDAEFEQGIREFIQVRGITPKEPDMSIDHLVYLIARSVKRDGIEHTPYMNEAFSEEAIQDLADLIGKEIIKI